MARGTESKTNDATQSTAPMGVLYDPGRRYPRVTSPEGYDVLPDLTKEDKRVGVKMLEIGYLDRDSLVGTPEHHAVQSRNPAMMYQSDPKLFERAFGADLSELVIGLTEEEIALSSDANGLRTEDPDVRQRYQLASLIIAKVAHEIQDEWTLRSVATLPASNLSMQQLALLGQPQSVVWDEEQRLTLEFAEGVMQQTLSDECFARAEAAWGRKQTMRYAAWTAHYVSLLMFHYINVSDAERTGQWQTAGPPFPDTARRWKRRPASLMNGDIDSKTNDAARSAAHEGIIYDPGRRYPLIMSPEGYDALTYLTDEEKRIGVELLKRNYAKYPGVEQPPDHAAVQARNPYMMYQSDPELFAVEDVDSETLYGLVVGISLDEVIGATDANPQELNTGATHRNQMSKLIIAKVAYEHRHEWMLTLMATHPALNLSMQQFALLGQPQSVVWDDEQRLLLEFADGIIHRAVTDECFARTEAVWGRKQTMRYAAMIMKYVATALLLHVNVTDAEKAGFGIG